MLQRFCLPFKLCCLNITKLLCGMFFHFFLFDEYQHEENNIEGLTFMMISIHEKEADQNYSKDTEK